MEPGRPAIDLVVLEELLRGSRELGLKMAALFERESADALAALAAAERDDDREAIRFQAHRLRGTARIVGAQSLAEACAALAGADETEAVGELIVTVRGAVEPAHDALLGHVRSLPERP